MHSIVSENPTRKRVSSSSTSSDLPHNIYWLFAHTGILRGRDDAMNENRSIFSRCWCEFVACTLDWEFEQRTSWLNNCTCRNMKKRINQLRNESIYFLCKMRKNMKNTPVTTQVESFACAPVHRNSCTTRRSRAERKLVGSEGKCCQKYSDKMSLEKGRPFMRVDSHRADIKDRTQRCTCSTEAEFHRVH